jgi:hypothetical protein
MTATSESHSQTFALYTADAWHLGPADFIAFIAGCARACLRWQVCEFECKPIAGGKFTFTARSVA